jgi:predicted permease
MSGAAPTSPRLARRLLEWLLPSAEREFVIGDLEETFAAHLAAGVPVRAARHAYWRAALTSIASLRARTSAASTNDLGEAAAADGTVGARSLGALDSGCRADRRPERVRRALAVFRNAWRGLMLQPGYTALVAATLALGIGVSTVMFAVADWLVLRPIAGVQDPDRLVTVWASRPPYLSPIAEAERADLESQTSSFQGLAGYWTTPIHVLAPAASEARRLQAQLVSGAYFDLLGPRVIARGRGFTEDEGRDAGQAAVAIISHRMWRRDFDADPSVLGHSFIVNRQPVTVVGVATNGFHGVQRTDDVDVWLPVAAHRIALPLRQGNLVSERRAALYYALVGRLQPGSAAQAAEEELTIVRQRLIDADPASRRFQQIHLVLDTAYSAPPLPPVRARLTGSVAILFAAAVLVLLLTCASAGGLMLARSLSRRRDVAVRLALGATRGMILRQCFVESLLLSAAGAAAALAASTWVLTLLRGTVIYPDALLPPVGEVKIDGRVLAFAVGLAALAGVAASVLPAAITSRSDVRTLDMSPRAIVGRRHRLARRTLAVVQTALSLVLLVGAILLLRSLAELRGLDPGFDLRPLIAFSVDPGLQGYGVPERDAFYRELMARVQAIPGVQMSTITWWRPFYAATSLPTVRAVERPNREGIRADSNGVGADYFATLGVPLVDGREFVESDFLTPSADSRMVIVNEALAVRLFGTRLAAGRQVLIEGRKAPAEVAGVIADVRSRLLKESSPPQIYTPFWRASPPGSASILVRTTAPPDVLMPRLRDAVRALDPTAPVVEMLTLSDAIDQHLAEPVLLGRLSGVFACFATLLSGLGIYGLFGRMVVERRPEFAIRVALGATPGGVLRLVVSDALRLSLIAVALGMAAAYWLVPLLRERLFGVSPLDVLSFTAAGAGIVAVALAAALLPARRAARVDPIAALRE